MRRTSKPTKVQMHWQVGHWTVLLLMLTFMPLTGPDMTAAALKELDMPTPTATAIKADYITLSGHTSGITVLAWSPDDKLLASATGGSFNFESSDYNIRLWDRTGASIAILTGHTGSVSALAWSPDGKILASGANDATIRLWRSDGTLIRSLSTQTGIVFRLAWSPDGSTLAAGIVADPTHNLVQLWHTDGTLVKTLSTAYSGGKFYNLAWSPNGRYLVGGAVSYTEWRADGTPIFSNPGCEHCTPFWGFDWAPDSSRWAIGAEGGDVQIYTVDGKFAASFINASGNVDALAWSPDGQLLAGGSILLWSPDGTIKAGITITGDRTSTLVWTPDGHWLAASDGSSNAWTNTIYLWNRQTQTTLKLKGHSAPVVALAWSPDGKLLASGSLDRTIRLWSIDAIEQRSMTYK